MRNVCTLGVSSTVLFFLREINRFLETLSSFCIFEKALFLDPRDSRLYTRDSNVSSIEARGSSLEVQVSSVNLLLSGTVYGFYLPDDHKLYSQYFRSVTNTSVANLVKEIESHIVCLQVAQALWLLST